MYTIDFINKIAPIIQKEAQKRGYKVCSAIIAQACIESAWGKSLLAYKYHNYFGMKCGSLWKGASVNLRTKEEYTKGILTTISDNFRAYGSIEEGIAGYFDFISTPRYSNLKTAKNAYEYLQFIKADGYATSSSYIQNNYNIVKQYNLMKYDNFKDSHKLLKKPAADKKSATKKQKAAAGTKKTITYKVVKGDTLSALAKKYNTTVNAIAKENNIKNVDLIYVGQVLKITKK